MDIKSVAKSHGLTMVQVAEKLEISKGGLSQLINGNPTINSLRSIADAIGCRVGDFFTDEMSEEKDSSPIIRCPHCGTELKIKIEKVVDE